MGLYEGHTRDKTLIPQSAVVGAYVSNGAELSRNAVKEIQIRYAEDVFGDASFYGNGFRVVNPADQFPKTHATDNAPNRGNYRHIVIFKIVPDFA